MGEMETDALFEEMIERCMQRLAAGEALDTALQAYPTRAAELRALLAPAQALRAAPIPTPSAAASSMAMIRMLAEVQSAASQPQRSGLLAGWLGWFKARPVAYRAIAVAGAVALFGTAGIGAAAATGSTPSPVRRILRISSDSERKVTLRGSIISISADALTLRPDHAGPTDARTIILTASTTISRQGEPVARGDLRIGDTVEVTGSVRGDSIEAAAIHVQDADAPVAATTAAAGSDATAAAQLPGADSTRTGDDRGGAADSTPGAGGGASSGETPEPGSGRRPDSTTVPGGGPHDGPDATKQPESTRGPDPTEQPDATRQPERTRTPEPTRAPAPTETPGH